MSFQCLSVLGPSSVPICLCDTPVPVQPLSLQGGGCAEVHRQEGAGGSAAGSTHRERQLQEAQGAAPSPGHARLRLGALCPFPGEEVRLHHPTTQGSTERRHPLGSAAQNPQCCTDGPAQVSLSPRLGQGRDPGTAPLRVHCISFSQGRTQESIEVAVFLGWQRGTPTPCSLQRVQNQCCWAKPTSYFLFFSPFKV